MKWPNVWLAVGRSGMTTPRTFTRCERRSLDGSAHLRGKSSDASMMSNLIYPLPVNSHGRSLLPWLSGSKNAFDIRPSIFRAPLNNSTDHRVGRSEEHTSELQSRLH